jgi:hypothetical protein
LNALAEPALAELNKIICRADVADADKLRAIEAVLDRIPGLSRRAAVDGRVAVDHEPVGPAPEYLRLVAEARARVAAMDPELFKGKVFELSDIQDAVVVDDSAADHAEGEIPPPEVGEAQEPEDDAGVVELWTWPR